MSKDTNPFAALLGNVSTEAPTDQAPTDITLDTNDDKTNCAIESIFGFTLNKIKKHRLVLLEDLAANFTTNRLNLEILEHALFERILLATPEEFTETTDEEICETKVILYLFTCFKKLEYIDAANDFKDAARSIIMMNVVTALKQPMLYDGQDLVVQLYKVIKNLQDTWDKFFICIYKKFLEDSDGISDMKDPFSKLLRLISADFVKASPATCPMHLIDLLNIFASHEALASILLDVAQPRLLEDVIRDGDTDAPFATNILGALFNVSILPKTPHQPFEFFQKPLDQASNMGLEGILWANINKLVTNIHGLFMNLLRCSPTIKSLTLTWLGLCLRTNVARGKLSNMQGIDTGGLTTVSDGFMINLGAVMMRLCYPFCCSNEKILKVDPTYCAVPNEDCKKKDIHMIKMAEETCLVPSENTRPAAVKFNFVTECFFMAHYTIDLGFRVIVEKLVRLNQDMARIERAYNDALNQASGMSDIVDSIKQRMESELTKYLSIKSSLSDPKLLESMFDFMSASAHWLSQIAVHVPEGTTSFAPMQEKPIVFPLPENIPNTLQCIPEFVVENLVCYLGFLRRFNPKVFEEQGFEKLQPILTFIVVYMGSPQYMRNPHLRARLAEALEALLPYHKDEPVGLNSLGGRQREQLFLSHPHCNQIIPSLLEVFVGIEMTGQSVQFEQKFNYRRPMYMVMDYLWEMDKHKQYFKQLAEAAEKNMDAVQPPLFLRFINLLINDAIFLLDESLANMAKLREMQTAREKGDWDKLPTQERAQNIGNMQHIGMLARFDNILGRDTTGMLERLTSQITIVFTHSTIVDRVAAMLNYFLLKLVGPNKKDFKVKDQKEFSFDPAVTVLDICKIYVNLKESDAFCLAISQDGRSYSPQLFTLAEDVLVRIGGGPLVGELQEVATRVSQKSREYQATEEATAEAPEHFLDPIMSTLMTDPVTLPSSKQTVDRTTIARHLLSDQTDPFNRAPLSMDQVIPNTKLAQEIRKWLEERQ